jgi:ligand-binding sensor domain-containing protein/signal transduction histidine kinase
MIKIRWQVECSDSGMLRPRILDKHALKAAAASRPIRWNALWSGCLAFFILCPPPAVALDPSKSIFQYNCRLWARQNGLPASAIYAIAQTRDGYLWLGTPGGLVRFDGDEFKLFDLSKTSRGLSAIVTSLAKSKDGGLWLGLEHGAFGYCDGRSVSLLGKAEWGGLNLSTHSILETAEGDVWIAAETLAARLVKGKTFEGVLAATTANDRADVKSLLQDSRGRIWLGTVQGGLYYWQDGVLTKFPDPELDTLNVDCIAEDHDGQIWVGTHLGLRRYDAKFQKKEFPFPWFSTKALLVDRHGAVWAGTSGGGLFRFSGETSTQFRKVDGLADDFVNALAEDEEGSLWVGTRAGLSQLSDVKIPTFGKGDGLTAEVNVAVSGSHTGGLWIATDQGFSHLDGSVVSYGTNLGLSELYINGILEAKSGDVYLLNGRKDIQVFSSGQIVASYPNAHWPTALTEDAVGVVAAIGGELFRVGTNSFAPYSFTNGVKPLLNWVFNLAPGKDGVIWVACDEGICRVQNGNYTLWHDELGGNTKTIWVCEDSDGTVWAGLETGIARLKDGKIRTINHEHGLLDNIIYAIVPDDYGSLWVDSSRGIFRVSRQSLNDFADRKTDHVECAAFNGLDAVKSIEKFQQKPSGCKTLDGRIWFPMAQGVVMIDPTNLTGNPVPPRVHIDVVRANGGELPRSEKVIVEPGRGELEFHYVGLSFIAPQKIRYRYKLDGYDQGWVEAGGRRSAFYTNLRPGRYAFQVEACNEDGVWSATAGAFQLQLLPHFYQTGWFLVSGALALALGLSGIYGWRVRHLESKQRQLQEAHDLLNEKVRERTGELAASNLSLKKEIEERERMQQEVERIHSQLIEASREAGQAEVASSVLHNVGNVLNSVNVSTSIIADRLRKIGTASLSRVTKMLEDHSSDLSGFITEDPKGRLVPQYLVQFALRLAGDQKELLQETQHLAQNVDHIKEIVAMQQSYAKVYGVKETVPLTDLVESAFKMHSAAYVRHAVAVVRDYEEVPSVQVEKHKVLQILVNVFHNAKYACDEGGQPAKQVNIRIRRSGVDRVSVGIADNGVGIAPENLRRIFGHGFTTKAEGHGFGLHSAALAAKELGGTLVASSEGLGKGATFTLELPVAGMSQAMANDRKSGAQ